MSQAFVKENDDNGLLQQIETTLRVEIYRLNNTCSGATLFFL